MGILGGECADVELAQKQGVWGVCDYCCCRWWLGVCDYCFCRWWMFLAVGVGGIVGVIIVC